MRRILMTLATLSALAAPAPADGVRSDPWRAALHRASPGIRVWTSRGDLFNRGDRVRVFFRTEYDAHVTIFRVDTDGRVRVLFPRDPNDDNWIPGGQTYQVSHYDRGLAFLVDDYPGVGYVFGVAAADPFDYGVVLAGDRWDARLGIEGRIHSDPLPELEEMATQMLPAGYPDFDTHLVPYYVEQHYEYPRFMCYDCHAYTPWYAWNPYSHWCSRFTLVFYSDPWYYYPSYWYPTRYYGGTQVVYVAPVERSRYVFKARGGSDLGIEYRDRRYEPGEGGRRMADVNPVRGRDVGGVGSVPAPRARDGQTAGGGRRAVVPGGAGGSSASGALPYDATDPRRRVSDGGATSAGSQSAPADDVDPYQGARRIAPAPSGTTQGTAPDARSAEQVRRRDGAAGAAPVPDATKGAIRSAEQGGRRAGGATPAPQQAQPSTQSGGQSAARRGTTPQGGGSQPQARQGSGGSGSPPQARAAAPRSTPSAPRASGGGSPRASGGGAPAPRSQPSSGGGGLVRRRP
jgi:hypothetical protein